MDRIRSQGATDLALQIEREGRMLAAAPETRARELVGCCENPAEAAELEAIADALDAFDAKAAG